MLLNACASAPISSALHLGRALQRPFGDLGGRICQVHDGIGDAARHGQRRSDRQRHSGQGDHQVHAGGDPHGAKGFGQILFHREHGPQGREPTIDANHRRAHRVGVLTRAVGGSLDGGVDALCLNGTDLLPSGDQVVPARVECSMLTR
jgi:hypothetical protein